MTRSISILTLVFCALFCVACLGSGEDGGDRQECADGSVLCPCYGNGTCDPGLECAEGVCIDPNMPPDADMSSDASNTPPDGDSGSTGANNVDPDEGLDELAVRCLEVDVQNVQTYSPAAVRSSFVVRHCDGPPMVRDLSSEDIEVINDVAGEPFNNSLEGGGASAPARLSDILEGDDVASAPTIGLYAILSLDLSNSIVESDSVDSVINAAQSFVDQIVRDAPNSYRYNVAIQVFGRTDATEIVLGFTSNYDAISARLDELRQTEGLGTTNLYGAYIDAVEHVSQQAQSADIVDMTMLVVTDGRHEAGDFENQRTRALSARDQAAARGVSVYSVAANAPDEDLTFLEELATTPSFFDAVSSAEQIRESFRRTSENLRRLPEATYVVGICTPVEIGDASFTVEVEYEGVRASGSAPYSTEDLTGDVSSCSPADVAEPCVDQNCGEGRLQGFSCGACNGGSCDAGLCQCPQETPDLCGGSCVSLDPVENCSTWNPVVQVSVAPDHTCGLKADGTVDCWGRDVGGQLMSPSGAFEQITVLGRTYGRASQNCGIKNSGAVACWGSDDDGASTPPSGSFQQISGGEKHFCGIKTDGTIACWGDMTADHATPPSGIFQQVSAGGLHTCGVQANGTVSCWGNADYGQSTPPSGTFQQISAGWLHTCGLKADGTVACWGRDVEGQSTPPSGSFRQISARAHRTCGVKADRTVACWGATIDTLPPSGSFLQVSAGPGHTCGVKTDGTVACWGKDGWGEATPPDGW